MCASINPIGQFDESFPMSVQASYRGLGVALVGMGCCFLSQAASQMMTFEQAVKQGLGLKGCSKQDIGPIESVYMADYQANPKGLRPGQPIYLVFQAKGAGNMPVIGPLAARPNDQQLQALRGKRTCVISE